LLGCVYFAGDPIGYTHFLVLVSFDCHPGSTFSHIGDARRCYFSSLSSPSDTTLSLSSEGHSRSDNNSLSLSLLGRSLARSFCSDVPASLPRSPPPAARALRIALSLLRKSALQQAGRPRAQRRKGPSYVDRGVIQSIRLCVPSPWGSAPSSALSPRPRRRLRSSSSAALAS
jgi:hypothetical protein